MTEAIIVIHHVIFPLYELKLCSIKHEKKKV